MVDLKVTKREQYLRMLLKHFWSRWTSEYLTELELSEHQRRSNKSKTLILPIVNDVVVIKEDNCKRLDWKVERVTELIYSNGNQIRAAKVNIISNKKIISLNRPVNKLFPFEVVDKNEEEVPTFIDQECGRGTECRGSLT